MDYERDELSFAEADLPSDRTAETKPGSEDLKRAWARYRAQRKTQVVFPYKPPPPPPPEWWDNRRFFTEYQSPGGLPGETTRLYTIGAVAATTGKSLATIRSWLRSGVLPEVHLRTAAATGAVGNPGRRLWTLEQIETIREVGLEVGVVGKRPSSMAETHFAERLGAMWAERGW